MRSVEALPMAQTVPLDEDQHPLPYFDRFGYWSYSSLYMLVICMQYLYYIN